MRDMRDTSRQYVACGYKSYGRLIPEAYMDSSTAARIFHDWAFGEGLMDNASAAVASSSAEFALIGNVTDKGTQILRQKRIRAIGFNSALGSVVVFTQRVAPRTRSEEHTSELQSPDH